jgi:DNA-binding phage protein
MEKNNSPAPRTLAVLEKPSADAAAMPRKRISKKILAAIDNMVAGEAKTIAAAAEAVGVARETLSRALSRPHVAEMLRTKVLKSLAMAAARWRRERGIARQQ